MNSKKRNIYGGGSNATKNGAVFESNTDLNDFLIHSGYTINNNSILFNDNLVGHTVPKHSLYKYLINKGIDYKKINSKKWLPDECIINEKEKVVFIVEKKYQQKSGSVDEKLASMEFKLYEYQKLFNHLGFEVRFVYLLSDWFKDNQYKDVLEYIASKEKCFYFFNEIALEFFQFSN